MNSEKKSTEVSALYAEWRICEYHALQAEQDLQQWFAATIAQRYMDDEGKYPIEYYEYEVRATGDYTTRWERAQFMVRKAWQAADAISILSARMAQSQLDLSLQVALQSREVSTARERVDVLKQVNASLDAVLETTADLSTKLRDMAAAYNDPDSTVGG